VLSEHGHEAPQLIGSRWRTIRDGRVTQENDQLLRTIRAENKALHLMLERFVLTYADCEITAQDKAQVLNDASNLYIKVKHV
jgi:hypothetical protein